MIGQDKPYAELPAPWTIARMEIAGVPKWYGLNKHTGQETVPFKSYGEALREVERREFTPKLR